MMIVKVRVQMKMTMKIFWKTKMIKMLLMMMMMT
jgi:hypothetical protein